jgi:hypothetical protein
MPPSDPDWRRIAAELVVHFHKSTGQTARIFGCSIPAVQQCVADYVRYHAVASMPSSGDSVFIPVALEENAPSDNKQSEFLSMTTPIPIEIITPGGLTLRLPLTNLDDIAHLLHSIEAKPC